MTTTQPMFPMIRVPNVPYAQTVRTEWVRERRVEGGMMSLRAEIRWKMDSRGMERLRSLLAYLSSSSPSSDETEDCCARPNWSRGEGQHLMLQTCQFVRHTLTASLSFSQSSSSSCAAAACLLMLSSWISSSLTIVRLFFYVAECNDRAKKYSQSGLEVSVQRR